MTRAVIVLLVLGIGLALGPRLARAGDAPRRSVAVLEFRQDVSAYPDLGDRMAKRLAPLAALRVVGPNEARQKAENILTSRRQAMDVMVEALMEKETLTSADIQAIMDKYPAKPAPVPGQP